MKRLFVSTSLAAHEVLDRAETEHISLNDLNADIARDRKIVLVGTLLSAVEAEAWKLVGSGLPATRIEVSASDDGGKIRDLFWRDAQPLRKAPGADSFQTYPSGIGFLDKNLGWRWRLRELMVVAGPYSSGKSTILQQLAFHFVATNGQELGDCSALICAWEDEAADMKRNLERFIRHQERIQQRSLDHLLDRIHYVCRPADQERLLDWYFELANFYTAKYNTLFHVLDPWNEMDHKKDVRVIETEYVRDAMRMFRKTIDTNRIIMGIGTHVPAKMINGDGSIMPFKIAHSFGSGNFGNKADRGLCVVRTKKFEPINGHTIWRLDKSKVEERMGRKGTVASRFDIPNFNMEYDAYATQAVADVWKD